MTVSKALGTTLKQGTTTIGKLTSISSPEKTADTKEVTTLDVTDGYKKYIQGLKDGGEVTVTGFFDITDTGQLALDTVFEAGTIDTYIITFPAAIDATFTFSGIVTKYAVGEANLEDPLDFEATIKVSGKPVLAVIV